MIEIVLSADNRDRRILQIVVSLTSVEHSVHAVTRQTTGGGLMIIGRIRQLLKRLFRLVVPHAEPWTYGRVRDAEKDRAWTSEQNEKLMLALGAQRE